MPATMLPACIPGYPAHEVRGIDFQADRWRRVILAEYLASLVAMRFAPCQVEISMRLNASARNCSAL